MVTSVVLKKRFEDIDLLKGLAIILMSFVHVNSLLFLHPFGLLDDVTYLGSTVCFVIFLFAFSFLQGKKLLGGKIDSWKKILKKILLLYLSYFVLGILSLLLHEGTITLSKILDVALLNHLPLYTEFLVLFIWFTIFFKIFSGTIQKLLKYPWVMFLISLIIYALGVWIYSLNVENEILLWIKMHLAGNMDIHVFSVFQYMPIYALGLIMAKYENQKKYLALALISLCIIIVLSVFNLSVWLRWPPSILYLTEGAFFIFSSLYVLGYLEKIKALNFIKLFGGDSLRSLVVVTSLSFLATWILFPSGNPYIVLSINAGVLVLSYCALRILKRSKV